MAAGVIGVERRAVTRRAPSTYGYEFRGHLRPGTPVLVLDLSPRGALVESTCPCRPGALTELHLDTPDGRRRRAAGAVARCWVASVTPLRFRAAVEFAGAVDLYDVDGG